MNVTNPDISPSQDDLDLPLKAEFPNFPPSNYTNFSLPSPDRHSSDTFVSCSPPDSPSNCLISSPAPSPSPSSNIISSVPSVLPIPSPPGHLSLSEQHSCEYDETDSCQQIRLSSELPTPQSYQYSISHNEESPPSISIHPVIKSLSSSPPEFPSPSVSIIPLPFPLTEKTPLLSGDRLNEDYQELSSCPPPPLSPPPMSPINSQTINTSNSQFIDDSCILRLSPPHRKPFYSLSPKSELCGDKSPLAIPSSSSSPSLPNLLCGDDLAKGTGTDVGSPFNSPMVEAKVEDKKDVELVDSTICLENDVKPSTSSSSDKGPSKPVQVVPCIVDLTGDDDECIGGDDDDEVEIVSADQPVVCLGRETNNSNITGSSSSGISSRRSKKRKRHESSRVESTTVEETIIINDSVQDEALLSSDGPPSLCTGISTIINVSDSPERTDDATTSISNNNNNNNSSSSSSSNRINSGIFELSSPRLFGDLLNSSVIPLENNSSRTQTNEELSSSSVCTCSSASSSDGHLCNAHHHHQHHRAPTNLLNHLALHRYDSREERRQSSMDPPHPPPPPPPVVIGSRTSFLDAPIPQDVINDLQSLLEDDHRHHSSYLRNYLFSPSASGASGSSSDCFMSGRQRPGYVSRILPEMSTTIEVEVHPCSSYSSTLSQSSSTSAINTATRTADSSASSSSSLGGSSLDFADDSGGLSCPICFESFQDIKNEGRSLSSTVCGHIFCTTCLEASLKQTKQCPTCRKRLRKKQYHPLYI